MDLSRRELLRVVGATCAAAAAVPTAEARPLQRRAAGWVRGPMTGAEAVVETLLHEGVACVYGIPGAQENELWDAMKSRRLPYLLCTHEFSAAAMADGYARVTGQPGVLCVVPGPGLTNSLSGLGESLLDSIPVVCLVGDVANGRRQRPFQVHSLDQEALLRPVTKETFSVQNVGEIPQVIRQAFNLARAGEPGPVGVVIPYNLLIEQGRFNSPPLPPAAVPFDEAAARHALALMSHPRQRVGIYAGLGCMDYAPSLVELAELLQAPVATSLAGKGVIAESHPLACGWGYGPQGTKTAEEIFKTVDVLLAIGVKYSEVSTGFYGQPQHRTLIHVDINRDNLGRIMRTTVCVHADAGVFLSAALAQAEQLRRPPDRRLCEAIARERAQEIRAFETPMNRCGVDLMVFYRALRRHTACDALAFVDVTLSQYWMAEGFTATGPRTFFNPTNNQGMGWSIPAAIGAQRIEPGRQVFTITGDGCFLMSGMETSTAAREDLPVKFFVIDDQSYRYMQELQNSAYLRTTATILARLDYRALAQGWGLAYQEILDNGEIDAKLRGIWQHPGPVLVRVVTDYHGRPVRWIDAVRRRYINELSPDQKVRFMARIGSRAVRLRADND
ncbi:MAG: thiamine pyrophosphate-binding protein [Gemmataceae bacterium]|nr:thiamine pyrophosphate-binding protein [Gemmataceae bacterium]